MAISIPESDRAALLTRRLLNALLFDTPGGRRFTVDSPVLPDVWLAYALAPGEPQELIVTVDDNRSAGPASVEIKERIYRLRNESAGAKAGEHEGKNPPRITAIFGQVAVRVYLDELIRVILPLTPWWKNRVTTIRARAEREELRPFWAMFPDLPADGREDLVLSLFLMRAASGGVTGALLERTLGDLYPRIQRDYLKRLPIDMLWLVRVAGVIAEGFYSRRSLFDEGNSAAAILAQDLGLTADLADTTIPNGEEREGFERIEELGHAHTSIADNFARLFHDWDDQLESPIDYLLWRITKNRKIELAVNKSTMTVKADAARRLFDVSSAKITWAIIDSGIDREHPAFFLRDQDGGVVKEGDRTMSRVIRTLDFTDLRDLLDVDKIATDRLEEDPERKALFEALSRRRQSNHRLRPDQVSEAAVLDDLEELRRRIANGNEIDWGFLEPMIEDTNPNLPTNDHGTHVAGVLGADWIDEEAYREMGRQVPFRQRPRIIQGVCPEIRMIDVRVFRDHGDSDEFELLAAIQYLRWLNSRAGYNVVHGANLSLSLTHEVRRFGCGQTPICIECNEATNVGLVIVTAAGNRGYEGANSELGSHAGFRAISITDPGNADKVITVGATHRKRPHDYGVSYFSSRGPTGDGRVKPDIVAPGEKIKSATPNEGLEYKDGTSMAAPLVSGAAAMLMARHTELIGKPMRIKEILMSTATDLGRDSYFQGAGLVDILRAIQSV